MSRQRLLACVTLVLTLTAICSVMAQPTPPPDPNAASQKSEEKNRKTAAKKPRRKRVVTNLSGFELAKPEKARKQSLVVGATRNSVVGSPISLAPKLAKLYGPSPRFFWTYARRAHSFLFRVYDQSKKEIFRATSAATSFAYPNNSPGFEPGKTYYWTVETVPSTLGTQPSDAAGFQVVTAEDRRQIDSALRAATAPDEYHLGLAKAQIFRDQRLWYDAIAAYSNLIEQHPNRPELYQERGMIYAQIESTQQLAEQDFSQADELDWKSLVQQAKSLLAQGDADQALPLAQEGLRRAEAAFGRDHLNVATALLVRAELYATKGNLDKAEQLYRRALNIREGTLGPRHLDVAESLNDLAILQTNQGHFEEAEKFLTRALSIYQSPSEVDPEPLAKVLNNLGLLYVKNGRFEKAETHYRQSLTVSENHYGQEHEEVGSVLSNLGMLLTELGRFEEAETLLLRALEISEKTHTPGQPNLAYAYNNLAVLYFQTGRFKDVLHYFQLSETILEKAYGPKNPDLAIAINNRAYVNHFSGRYESAVLLYQRVLAIREEVLGPDHPDIAVALNNIAGVYQDQARFGDAEDSYQRALAIWEKALGPDHPDVALALGNLAGLYDIQGRPAAAVPLYQRALSIRKGALGPGHPLVATSLNNLATAYANLKRYAESEKLQRRALDIWEKKLGPDHPDVAIAVNNLGDLLRRQKKYADSEILYQRALTIREKVFGQNHPLVAQSFGNLAILMDEQGQFEAAEGLHRKSLSIYQKLLGDDHPDTGAAFYRLATHHFARGGYNEAGNYFSKSMENLRKQFQEQFTYMSEHERLSFLKTVSARFPVFFNFGITRADTEPSITGEIYNIRLFQKGLVGRSMTALRARIAATGNAEALSLLEQLTSQRTQIANLYATVPDDLDQWRESVRQFQQAANDLEKQLARRSSALTDQDKVDRITWQGVQAALQEGEAAVELIHVPGHNGRRWLDKGVYIALIVTARTTTSPKLVTLGDATEIEQRTLPAYWDRVSPPAVGSDAKKENGRVAKDLWAPIESALDGARRVYLSLDGPFNTVAWEAIPLDENQLLLEGYDLRIVDSTKDILQVQRRHHGTDAVLIGNPTFDYSQKPQRPDIQLAQGKNIPSSPAQPGILSRDQRGGILKSLPATAIEITNIQKLLQDNGWGVKLYSEENALEDVVKKVNTPRVLHIATHGFFLPDQTLAGGSPTSPNTLSALENPMLRSGLFFAGANRTLNGDSSPAGSEDGILTALEASGLNLHETELVVLSACETGLGQVQNGEGVFGLRRALQIAGAQGVLMSLWSVPDQETQELMTLFYEKWVSGQDKHGALREAKIEMRRTVRQRYGADLPYYWASFVLVGR